MDGGSVQAQSFHQSEVDPKLSSPSSIVLAASRLSSSPIGHWGTSLGQLQCNESVLVTYLIVVTDYYNCIFPNCLSVPYVGISTGDSVQVTSQIKSPFVD
jgi:hypothetical protein